MSGISVCWGRWGRPLPRGLSATEGWSSSRWGSCFSPRDCEGIDLSKYCSCWGSTVAWLWTSQEEEVRTGRKGEGEKRDSRKEDMRLIYCVITGANSASRTFEFCFHTHILCHIFDYCLAMYVVLQIWCIWFIIIIISSLPWATYQNIIYCICLWFPPIALTLQEKNFSFLVKLLTSEKWQDSPSRHL